ncbi:MAG: TlpA family protein disulfide reductase [Chitinophagaceae bacterium]
MKWIAIVIFFVIGSHSFAQSVIIPDFRFARMDNGKDFVKKDIPAGKKTLFVFFDITCPHCKMALTQYNEKSKYLNDINIILITKDDKTEVQQFLNKVAGNLIIKKNLTILSDTYNQFVWKFKPSKYPSMFLYTSKQTLIKYSDEESDVSEFVKLITSKS